MFNFLTALLLLFFPCGQEQGHRNIKVGKVAFSRYYKAEQLNKM